MRNYNLEAKLIIKNYPYIHYYKDPFKVLITTILSQRSKDENTLLAAKNLFSLYETPKSLSYIDYKDIYSLIKPAGLYKQKSKYIINSSRIIYEKYNSLVPKSNDLLTSLPGVGNKTANIVLFVSFNIPALAVDTHVHRISNRLGWINTKNPDETEKQLKLKLHINLWGPINASMVAFGQQTCKAFKPMCYNCILSNNCKYFINLSDGGSNDFR